MADFSSLLRGDVLSISQRSPGRPLALDRRRRIGCEEAGGRGCLLNCCTLPNDAGVHSLDGTLFVVRRILVVLLHSRTGSNRMIGVRPDESPCQSRRPHLVPGLGYRELWRRRRHDLEIEELCSVRARTQDFETTR